MNEEKPGKRVVACNFHEDISSVALGSKCYLVNHNPGGGADRIEILARSRSGRWIKKWESIWRLTNFRVVTLVPGCREYHNEFVRSKTIPEERDPEIKAAGLNEIADREREKRGISKVDTHLARQAAAKEKP